MDILLRHLETINMYADGIPNIIEKLKYIPMESLGEIVEEIIDLIDEKK